MRGHLWIAIAALSVVAGCSGGVGGDRDMDAGNDAAPVGDTGLAAAGDRVQPGDGDSAAGGGGARPDARNPEVEGGTRPDARNPEADGGTRPDARNPVADGDTRPADGDAEVDGGTPLAEIIPSERRVVWEGNVGIPGGIPARTEVCATIDASSYGNGSADATEQIQDALDMCPEDQVVFLPAGTYRVTGTLFVRDHTVLRGAGPDVTTISYEGPAGGRSGIAFTNWPNFGSAGSVSVTAGATKGSTTVTVADASAAAVGSVMLVDQLNDGSLVDPNGVEGKCTYCGRADGDRTLGQLVEVTAVNGNQVNFNIPLYWTYDAALSPQATFVSPQNLIRWAGLEELTLTQPVPAVTYLIELQGAQYCWLKNVEVERVDWRAVWVLVSLQNEIRESYFHDSINGYGRSHGYGVLIDMFSSANLVENNMFRTLDGGFMMTAGGAAGNVFGYNYTEDARFDDPWWATASPCLNHAPHPMMNLWEGNVGYQLSADFIHGSSSHNTVFRSVSRGWQSDTITSNNNAVELATKNTSYNVVGCVLGTAGRSTRYEVLPGQPYDNTEVVIWALGIMHGVEDDNVAATLLRHGNYDFVNDDVIWDPNIEPQTLPPSLYLPARPAWFGDVPFPPIGPDVDGLAAKIPAQLRFESLPNP